MTDRTSEDQNMVTIKLKLDQAQLLHVFLARKAIESDDEVLANQLRRIRNAVGMALPKDGDEVTE